MTTDLNQKSQRQRRNQNLPTPSKAKSWTAFQKRWRVRPDCYWKKMKTNRDIIWNEKGELKYKYKIVHGSNIVDLVNDVLRKRKYFNPEGYGKLSAKHREEQMYHKTWSGIQIDGDTSLRPKEHQAVNDRKVRHPLDMTLQKFRKVQDVNRNGLNIKESGNWVSWSYRVVLLQCSCSRQLWRIE